MNNGSSEESVLNGGSAGPVNEFGDMTLTCSATGDPTPTIFWLKDGIVLSNSSRRNVTSTFNMSNADNMFTISTLLVSEVMLADNGSYTCRAVSGNVSPIPGQTAWTFQLDVKRESLHLSHQLLFIPLLHSYIHTYLLCPQLEMNAVFGIPVIPLEQYSVLMEVETTPVYVEPMILSHILERTVP